jgi:hypothetical protein
MSDILKHIGNPDPEIVRLRELARGKAGQVKESGCMHPMSAVDWVVDDDSSIGRHSRPTNLFVCSACNGLLRLVDFNGKEAVDG